MIDTSFQKDLLQFHYTPELSGIPTSGLFTGQTFWGFRVSIGISYRGTGVTFRLMVQVRARLGSGLQGYGPESKLS